MYRTSAPRSARRSSRSRCARSISSPSTSRSSRRHWSASTGKAPARAPLPAPLMSAPARPAPRRSSASSRARNTLRAGCARASAQLGNMLVALGVMWAFANIPPQLLSRFAFPVYMVGVLLLVGVAMFGEVVNGARRWLDLGVTRIQPSELMKIAVPLALAWYFDRYETSLRLRHYVVGAVMLLVPVAMIVRQPDLGTSVLILASGCFVLFLAGLSWRILIGLGIAGGDSLPFAWS